VIQNVTVQSPHPQPTASFCGLRPVPVATMVVDCKDGQRQTKSSYVEVPGYKQTSFSCVALIYFFKRLIYRYFFKRLIGTEKINRNNQRTKEV
jgi:hypothetical protein